MTITEQTDTGSQTWKDIKIVDFYDGYVIVTKSDDETFTIDSENLVTIKA